MINLALTLSEEAQKPPKKDLEAFFHIVFSSQQQNISVCVSSVSHPFLGISGGRCEMTQS